VSGELGRLALLADGRRPPGVYASPPDGALAGTLVAALRARGLAAWHLDTTGVATKHGFLAHCGDDLALPTWFGRNWDALVDALRDLPVPPPGGVILWTGAGSLGDEVRRTALDVFAERTLDRPPLSIVLTEAVPGVTRL
jgi:Barstar (barnase inhibitor)